MGLKEFLEVRAPALLAVVDVAIVMVPLDWLMVAPPTIV
jgi:hypothetical protein